VSRSTGPRGSHSPEVAGQAGVPRHGMREPRATSSVTLPLPSPREFMFLAHSTSISLNPEYSSLTNGVSEFERMTWAPAASRCAK
jgi:hypothetical protein